MENYQKKLNPVNPETDVLSSYQHVNVNFKDPCSNSENPKMEAKTTKKDIHSDTNSLQILPLCMLFAPK